MARGSSNPMQSFSVVVATRRQQVYATVLDKHLNPAWNERRTKAANELISHLMGSESVLQTTNHTVTYYQEMQRG